MPIKKITISEKEGIEQYTLINEEATLAVMILNYGATLTHLLTPDKTGHIRDVVLGFDDWESYKNPFNRYFGATIGRYANRIGQGKMTIDGETYTLETNNGPNSLHGGLDGFDKRLWNASVISESPPSIRLELVSPDGDQGFPGELTTQVTYTVTDDNALEITYRATTTKETVVNLTNHSYFNLAGVELNPDVRNTHITMTDSVQGFLELDENALPTGKELTWSEAPFMDFTRANAGKTIGERIGALVHGYDHPYVIHRNYVVDTSALPLQKALVAYAPETGIELEFSTTEPTFQFYTAGWLEPGHLQSTKQQGEVPIGPYAGFCCESSRNPDAPNKPDWRSSVLLQPDDTYASKTVFRFSTRQDNNPVLQ